MIRSLYQGSQILISRLKDFIIELFFKLHSCSIVGHRYFWPSTLNVTILLQVGRKLRQRHPGLKCAGHEAGAGEGLQNTQSYYCILTFLTFFLTFSNPVFTNLFIKNYLYFKSMVWFDVWIWLDLLLIEKYWKEYNIQICENSTVCP